MKSVVEKYENHAVLICQGTYKGSFIIDLDIADEVAKHSWNINHGGFIKSKIKGQAVTLQRFITGAEKGDRIASNRAKPHDMRRENLLLIKRDEGTGSLSHAEKTEGNVLETQAKTGSAKEKLEEARKAKNKELKKNNSSSRDER